LSRSRETRLGKPAVTPEHDGHDLYPIFRENIERPEYYINDKVRIEVARYFGYMMTESSGHLSEHLYWFRKNRDLLDEYCDQPPLGGESGIGYRFANENCFSRLK
jgi:alpha-galactosidase